MNLYIALVAGNVHNMIGWAMGGGGGNPGLSLSPTWMKGKHPRSGHRARAVFGLPACQPDLLQTVTPHI